MKAVRSGVPWIIGATLLFVSLDCLGKYLISTYSLTQIVWARFFFHFLFVVVLLGPRLKSAIRSQSPRLQLTRSSLMLLTNVLFFWAVSTMPLVNVTSLLLVGPLFVTMLSVPLLKEKVGARRWTSVAVGFCGAMVVVQPGPDIFQSMALVGLLAALSNAFYSLTTRMLSTCDPSLTTLLYTTVVGTILSSIWVPFQWVEPTAFDWLLLAMLGLLGALGHFGLIKALSLSQASTIAPFSYLTLVWASTLGFIVFNEVPMPSTILGAVIIVGSGLYVFYREQKLQATS